MTDRRVRLRYAERQAVELAAAFPPSPGGYLTPIPRVLDHLGIEYDQKVLTPRTTSLLITKGARAVIVTNDLHGPERRRFATAHAIGHYVLHVGGNASDVTYVDKIRNRVERAASGIDPDEMEANVFAANLLMPLAMVNETFDETFDTVESEGELVEVMAHGFMVPTMAMSWRLQGLGLLDPMGG